MAEAVITGGCLCQAVRFEIGAEPLAARTCWCRDCQYLAAGSPTVNVIFPANAVSITGEIRVYESLADSGNVMLRGFCPTCGTPLTSASKARPELIIIRVGALDDPNLIAPQATIWSDSAPDWGLISDGIPKHPAQMPVAT